MRIDFSKVECCRLSDTTTGIDTFENKEKELVDFIQNDALDDQNKKIGTTWTWTYDKNILIRFHYACNVFNQQKNISVWCRQVSSPHGTISVNWPAGNS